MSRQKRYSILHKATKFEEYALCLLLSAMIVLACLQIVLRSFFASGLLWADPVLRYMVLWSGLLGACMATSKGSHIALDLAGYLIPERLQPLVHLCCYLFSTITAAFLSWSSFLFISSEIEYSSTGLLGIPTWGWNLIFPLAFIIITLRYLLLLISSTISIFHKRGNIPGVRR